MKRLIGYVVCFVDEHDEIEGLASASIGGYHEACASLRREREIYKHTKARLRIVRLDGSVHRPGSKLPADRQCKACGGPLADHRLYEGSNQFEKRCVSCRKPDGHSSGPSTETK